MRRILLLVALLSTIGFAMVQPARADSAPPPVGKDDVVVGKSDAPITIIEYASLTCPHCAEFENQTWPQIKKDWVDTGKARYVFRDFPLDGLAARAAVLAHCAPPERFIPFIETLYANQMAWVVEDPDAAMQDLQRIGLMGGVPAAKFQACEADQALQQKVVASRQAGENAGVNATPTFFINGTKITGALPYADFQKALTAAAGKGS